MIRLLGHNLLVALLGLGLLMHSCTSPEEIVEPIAVMETGKPPENAREMLVALDRVTGKEGPTFQALLDVRSILAAQAAEEDGKNETAIKYWFEAMGRAEGRFGKIAFEGWVKAYVANLNKKTDAEVLAKLLLAESRNGLISAFMLREGLTADDVMVDYLWQLTPTALTASTPADDANDDEVAPPTTGIPKEDPLLVQTAKRRCRAADRFATEWTHWSAALPITVQVYWNALVNECNGHIQDAMAEYNSVYERLSTENGTRALAIEALDRLAVLQRRNERRPGAADSYLALMKIWETKAPTAAAFGEDANAFHLRKINHALWAARYRSYIGDYENAKIFANRGLEYISQAFTAQPYITDAFRRELAVLRAEAYHDLAFRVALEKKAYDQAVSLNLMALQSKHLTDEWKDRLVWLAGLYEYLGGNYRSAKKYWEILLNETKDETMRPRLYFWLAKCYDRLNMKAESRFYMQAVGDDFPINYYAVVAPHRAGLEGAKDWKEIFGEVDDLKKRLTQNKLDIADINSDKTLHHLWMRAQTLAVARISQFAQLATKDLQSEMNDRLLPKSNPDAFVALTRLQYQTGLYLSAIALTTTLEGVTPGFWERYPEQLLVYFPLPFSELYERHAAGSSLDKEVLLAISRQESGFTADIKSHADARGLMQMILPTAKRFAEEAGVDSENLKQTLLTPEMNVLLGSRFLRFLSMHFDGFLPAVFGAYNAGEEAMGLWLKSRNHSDPLLFVEMIPFGETNGYIKNVWRNLYVYRFLNGLGAPVRILPPTAADETPSEQEPMPDLPSTRLEPLRELP